MAGKWFRSKPGKTTRITHLVLLCVDAILWLADGRGSDVDGAGCVRLLGCEISLQVRFLENSQSD